MWNDLTATFTDPVELKNTRYSGNFWEGRQDAHNTCPTVFDPTTFQLGIDENGCFVPEQAGQFRARSYTTVRKVSDEVLNAFLVFEYEQYGKIRAHMAAISDSIKMFDTAIHYGGVIDLVEVTTHSNAS